MQPIGMTLRALREDMGLQQVEVAEWLSRHYKPTKAKSVSSWERSEAMPNAEQLLHLCALYRVDNVREVFMGISAGLNALGVTKLREYAALLETSSQYSYTPKPPAIRILRLYTLPASAGTGQFLDGDDFEFIEADASVTPLADSAIRISGDSMTPQYLDRQIVWVHEQLTIENGEVGIFILNGDSYIKQYRRDGDSVSLVSFNEVYQPIPLTEGDSLRVYGKVVGSVVQTPS